MKIQHIQSQLQNNNSFKAHFIPDSKGYFCALWRGTMASDALSKKINQFTSMYEGHNLEIINFKETMVMNYEVFNHKTGRSEMFWVHKNSLTKVLDLLSQILSRTTFFEESTKEVKLYQQLTGINNKKTYKI